MSTPDLTVRTTTAALLAAAFLAGCGGDSPEPEASSETADAQQKSQTGATLSAEAVRTAVADRIHRKGDSITVTDPTSGETVRLVFDHVHEHVKTTDAGRKYVCVDFVGPDSTVYDLDYYVDQAGGAARVEDRLLHKVGDTDVVADSVRKRLDTSS